MCLDYTLGERNVSASIRMTNEAHNRTEFPEKQNLEEQERTQTEVGAPSGVFGSFQADCYAFPIPDIPEAACWLRALERLVLEQHVRHSSNHLSKPQARQNATSTRQSFVPVNFRPEKVLWNFHSHKGHIFPATSARPILISLAPDT